MFYNNLAANLVQRLIVSISGHVIYDYAHKNLMRTYSDMWLSQRSREELIKFGVCDSLMRNCDNDDETDKKNAVTTITKKLCGIFKHQKIPIGKIISDQGLMVPSASVSNLKFTLVLSDPSKVLSKGSNVLNQCELEYNIRSKTLKDLVVDHYISSTIQKIIVVVSNSVEQRVYMLINKNINYTVLKA